MLVSQFYDLVKGGFGTKCPYFLTTDVYGPITVCGTIFCCKTCDHVSTYILYRWKFSPGDFCLILPSAFVGENFIHVFFLSCVNDYIHLEDMATFTALVTEYNISNSKVPGLGENLFSEYIRYSIVTALIKK